MSPEMVERVAYQLRIRYDPAHPSMDDCARYALALAERAAREATMLLIADEHDSIRETAEAAVQRAVEGA